MAGRPTFHSPSHDRYSPTKSSPLRHTVSTRSNNSETDRSSIPSRQGTISSNATSYYSQSSHNESISSDDPFITRVGSKRDRSESPVKKSAVFAKWEQRERTVQDEQAGLGSRAPPRMDLSPKKLRDDDWRSNIGKTEVATSPRAVLGPVHQNAAPERLPPPSHGSDTKGIALQENIVQPQLIVDKPTSFTSQPEPSKSRSDGSKTTFTPKSSDTIQSPPSLATKNSLATLSRSDSVRGSTRPSRPRGQLHISSSEQSMPHLDNQDLENLEKSSTPQLRHLSRMAAENVGTDELEVHTPQEQVTGLAGRRRLQRSGSNRVTKSQSKFASAYTNTKWMDTQRKHLAAYEYLCHIGEARAWLEDVLEPDKLPPIVELEHALRDGVTLAEAVVRLAPSLPAAQQRALGSQRIFRSPRLQFRHSDNIALFFRFLAEIELPELFRFELVDLYEKKNIPKVIYCIHALSWMLFRKGIVEFHIGNLVGQLQFEDHELEETQKGIDRSGVAMPNFGGMREAMQIEEPSPPEPTPEELLAEQEEMIVDLQTQVRGALVRMRLGSVMQDLWDAEAEIAHFQSIARGGFARQVFNFRHSMDASTRRFQAASKAFLLRRAISRKQSTWENNQTAVIRLQSLWRGRQQRAETQMIKTQLSCHKHGLKEFQAMIRGALGRWRASDVWEESRNTQNEEQVQALQAAARGAIERLRIGRIMNSLWDIEHTIVDFQAVARASRVRSRNKTYKSATRQETAQVVELQAAVRGLLQRFRNKQQHGQWHMHESGVIQAQAAARGLLERLRQARTQGALQGRETAIVKLQTVIRARNARQQHGSVTEELQDHHNPLSILQALARGQASRQQAEHVRSSLRKHEQGVLTLQGLTRAMLERRRIGTELAVLEDAEDKITELQSLARAYLERQRVFEQLVEMEREEEQIIQLQALTRAMLVRSSIGHVLADLEHREDEIVGVQAALRGFVIRRRFAEKRRHYHENMQKVIKLQSHVRMKQQGESYKSLVTGKNPPLPVVRRHLHLLTDSNLEFEGELEAERLRRQVVDSVRRNELVEKYVEGLDVKIALLVKNKITLDEVVKHQKHYGGSAAQLLRSGSTLSNSNGIDLKALNKNSRKKLTGYEELFFLLQTHSQYLTRLFAQVSSRGLPEKDSKNLERLMLALFGHAQKSREEHLLIKVLAQSNQLAITQCQSLEDLTRQQPGTFHHRLFLNYVRSPRDRAYLKTLLGSMIRNGICAQDHLDLESDPLQIYRAILNNEELSTGRPSQRPRDPPREVVIRQDDVRPRYVEHLEDLRDLGDAFFASLEETLHRMPYGIRYLAVEQHRALCAQYPRDDPADLAFFVGQWLWKSYIFPAVREPELWGVVDRGLSPVHKRNLSQVVTLLGQVAGVGRLFGAENIYLQPLNSWVTESLDRWQTCLQNCFDIPSAEEHYDADQYSDLYSTTKPTLFIKLTDVFAIHGVIADNLNVLSSNRDDPVKEILMDLGTPKSNESDLGGAGNAGEITLTLKSRFTVQEDPNAETRALFMATKRLILYIIRVQTGSNLMEILLRPITYEDADRWIALVQEEIEEKEREQRHSRRPRSAAAFDPRHSVRGGRPMSVYSEAPSAFSSNDRRGGELQDLHGMTYAELKSSALENILQLEQPHVAPQYRVSRHNHYQELLNALASDIRQKHRRRVDRQREADATRATLSQLDSKATFLEEQLQSYNDYIEQCLHTLASKKQQKGTSTFRSAGGKFLLPFSKQWAHERELERAGRKPQFGSYKYSLRQLADKGVLLSWPRFTPDQWGNVDVVVSSDEVGVFHLEASSGSLMVPGASANVLLDELLQAQYDNRGSVVVFEEGSPGVSVERVTGSDGASLAVNLLLHLVFKKFYRDE